MAKSLSADKRENEKKGLPNELKNKKRKKKRDCQEKLTVLMI